MKEFRFSFYIGPSFWKDFVVHGSMQKVIKEVSVSKYGKNNCGLKFTLIKILMVEASVYH